MKNINPIAIVGASGKMGQEIYQILQDQKIPHFGISRNGNAENYSKVYTFKTAPLSKASGMIDFSLPEAFNEALQSAIENKVPLVSGTTGLSARQLNDMKTASKKIPILWSPNMSIGIAVLKKAIQHFSALNNFDFQIEELHHNKKKDAPSGTGISLQEILQKISTQKLPPIISIRAGGLIGTHKVHAVSNEEHLIFEHTAINRRVFASGAIRAHYWLKNKKNGLYSIEDTIHAP